MYDQVEIDNALLELVIIDSEEIMKTTKLIENDEYGYLRQVAHNNYLMKLSELD